MLCSLIILYSTCVIGWKYDELMIIEKINPPSTRNDISSIVSREICCFIHLNFDSSLEIYNSIFYAKDVAPSQYEQSLARCEMDYFK